jgi:hypothetical protein
MPPVCRHLLSWSLIAVALATAYSPALAQYTWRDAKGQLHASDQPPPHDIPDKNIIRRPVARQGRPVVQTVADAASSSRSAAASAPVDAELQKRRALAEQEAKAKAQAEEQKQAARRAENCQRARSHLASLDSGSRIIRMDARGERVVLDDASRAREAAEARGVIASDCR